MSKSKALLYFIFFSISLFVFTCIIAHAIILLINWISMSPLCSGDWFAKVYVLILVVPVSILIIDANIIAIKEYLETLLETH